MENALCIVSICPVRKEPNDATELLTQLLFGEQCQIIENQKQWIKIKIDFDGYEGWVDQKQILFIENKFDSEPVLVQEMVDFILYKNSPMALTIGAELPNFIENHFFIGENSFAFDGKTISGKLNKNHLVEFGYKYLNAPYLWGGKTPFGIDCSGLTQMVYKLCGYKLPRDAHQQAEMGEVLNFIEEAEPGDLAFFDNELGKIIHVGIILEDNKILHAHGKVRIDPMDHHGIFNTDLKKHSHQLRIVKKII
jgi:gamma-D-glutamyl-L-lysine dipeptidyl-peptidase